MKKRTCFILGLTSLLLSFSSCVDELDVKEGSADFQVDHSIALPIQKKKYVIKDFFENEDLINIKTYSDLIASAQSYISLNKKIGVKYEINNVSKNIKDLELDKENSGLQKGVLFIKCSNNLPLSGTLYLRFFDKNKGKINITDLKKEYKVEFPKIESGNVKNPTILDERIELTTAQWKEMKNVDRIYCAFIVDKESITSQKEEVNLNENDFIELSLGTFINYKKVIKK